MIPKWAEKYLSPADVEAISEVVKKAEQNTSGEIVPMVVHQSSMLWHLPRFLTVCLFNIVTLAVVGFYEHLTVKEISGIFIGGLILSFGLSYWLAKWPWLQRWLNQEGAEEQVRSRAMTEFTHHHLSATKQRTGILLFVSVLERKAVVLADRAISEKLAPEVWQEVVQLLTQGLQERQWVKGFSVAIEKCGQILATHFPAQGSNPNEIANHLILKE